MSAKSRRSSLFSRLIAMPLTIWLVFVLSSYGFYEVFLAQQHQAFHLEQQRGALADLMDKVEGLQDDSARYQQLQAQYNTPLVQGLLTPVQRVAWMDNLGDWVKQNLATELTLQFGAERSLREYSAKLDIDKGLFYISPLTLGVQLQTDADFFNLMAFINQNLSANVWIESCQLARMNQDLAQPLQFSAQTGHIQVLCNLQLYRGQPRPFDVGAWQ